MKTAKELEISLKALSLIKQSVAPLSSGEIAEQIGTTTGFLNQAMKKLRKSELVLAKHGPGGGYVINKQKQDINAFEVATALGYEFNISADSNSKNLNERLEAQVLNAYINAKI